MTTNNIDYSEKGIIPNLPHKRIEAHAASSPNSIALVAEEFECTYKDLNGYANYLACLLREHGVVKSSIVGIFLDTCPELVLATVATYKAGGTTLYIPVDIVIGPDILLSNVDFDIIVTCSKYTKLCHAFKCNILSIDDFPEIWNVQEATAPVCRLGPNDIETIFLTSGTGGLPKLVKQPFGWLQESNNNSIEEERHILKTWSGTTFTRAEILYPLVKGKILFISPNHIKKNIVELLNFIETNKISHLIASPSWLRVALNANCAAKFSNVQEILCAGEHSSLKLKESFAKEVGVSLKIMYGCTEVPGATSYIHHSNFDPLINTVGQVCPMKEVYVLNKNLTPVAVGEPGDIYLSGLMAAGYLNDIVETNARFVKNPFSNKFSDKMYKTGDMGRWLDGEYLQLLGREDSEIKVRGFRVNTEEVETILSSHPDIEICFVIPVYNIDSGDKIVAFYKPKLGAEITSRELIHFCEQVIAKYKIPSIFIQTDEFKLLDNGKIDKIALKNSYAQFLQEAPFESYYDSDEAAIIGIWTSILLHRNFGIYDNFFDVGGNSLSMVSMILDIEKHFGISIHNKEDFIHSITIRGILDKLNEKKKMDASIGDIIILKKGSTSNKLHLVPVMDSFYDYKDLITALDDNITVYGLKPRGIFDNRSVYGSIAELSAECAKLIEKTDENNIQIIAGYSGAGALAYATALELQKSYNQTVLLILLDAYCPYLFSTWRFSRALIGGIFIKRGLGTGLLLKFFIFYLKRLFGFRLKYSDHYIHSLMTYRPDPTDSPIHFLACDKSQKRLKSSFLGWKKYIRGSVEFSIFPGDHFSYIKSPLAREVALKLGELIDQTHKSGV